MGSAPPSCVIVCCRCFGDGAHEAGSLRGPRVRPCVDGLYGWLRLQQGKAARAQKNYGAGAACGFGQPDRGRHCGRRRARQRARRGRDHPRGLPGHLCAGIRAAGAQLLPRRRREGQ